MTQWGLGEEDLAVFGLPSTNEASASALVMSASMASDQRRRRLRLPWWGHLLVAVLTMALLQGFVVKLGWIPTGSMEQTLMPRQAIAIDRLSPRWDPVHDGEVVAFRADEAWEGRAKPGIDGPAAALRWAVGLLGYGPGLDSLLVKRIIASDGQQVSCCDAQGRVEVDGVPLEEPYIFENLPFEPGVLDCDSGSRRCFAPVTVPKGKLFVLGDHRSNSADSIHHCRGGAASPCARFVDRADVLGRIIGVKDG